MLPSERYERRRVVGVAEAAAAVSLTAKTAPNVEVRWGVQLDTTPLAASDDDSAKVAGYVAKYATKGAEVAGTVDHPIHDRAEIAYLHVDAHARRMIETCWELATSS